VSWNDFKRGFWNGLGASMPALRRRFCRHPSISITVCREDMSLRAHCEECGHSWGGQFFPTVQVWMHTIAAAPALVQAPPLELVAAPSEVEAEAEAERVRLDAHAWSGDSRPQ